jgi:glycogen(starch) synthase
VRTPAPSRVLVTADCVGGVWTYALDVCEGLARRGHEVLLAAVGDEVSCRRGRAAVLPGVAIELRPFRSEWMDAPWADVARTRSWLDEICRDWRPDLIHLNTYVVPSEPTAPTLLVSHSDSISWHRAVLGSPAPAAWRRYAALVGSALDQVDLVVAPTRAVARDLAESFGYEGDVRVIPNGRTPRHLPAAGPRTGPVLGVGRLWDAAKNLRALDRVAPRLTAAVELVGETRHPDGGDVSLPACATPGVLDPAALAARYRAAAVYALPARYEPFGLSALEAASHGCPLVLGDIASLRETWDGAAVFVDPFDDGALERALAKLLADPGRRADLGRAAARRALDFGVEPMLGAYLAAYASLSADVLRATG